MAREQTIKVLMAGLFLEGGGERRTRTSVRASRADIVGLVGGEQGP